MEQKQHYVAVGIDVAKATLSVCLRSREGKETALMIRNTKTDINKKLISKLHGFDGKIVLEATNHYHWLTALILARKGYNVHAVNPLLAKQYTSGNIRKVKTDKADAAGLARMAQVADNLPPLLGLDVNLGSPYGDATNIHEASGLGAKTYLKATLTDGAASCARA